MREQRRADEAKHRHDQDGEDQPRRQPRFAVMSWHTPKVWLAAATTTRTARRSASISPDKATGVGARPDRRVTRSRTRHQGPPAPPGPSPSVDASALAPAGASTMTPESNDATIASAVK